MICTYFNTFITKDNTSLTEIHWLDDEENFKTNSKYIPTEKIANYDKLKVGSVFTIYIGISKSGKGYIKNIFVTDEEISIINLHEKYQSESKLF